MSEHLSVSSPLLPPPLLLLLLQASEKRIGQLKQALSSLPPLDTEGQLSDLLPYYYTVTELRTTTEAIQVRKHT